MTKEITKAIILQELMDKFGLREFEAAKFLFDETVVPVYDIDKHLSKWDVTFTTVSITSGPTGFYFFSVPENERWIIDAYNVVFMAAGAYTVTGLYIAKNYGSASIVYLDMIAGQTVSYAKVLPSPITLEPLNTLYVYVDGYTSTADLRVYLHYMKEEIR